jgi:hypothetical protein
VHLAEEFFAARVVCLCPEVFALDSKFICLFFELGVNFFVVILLWIVRELLESLDRVLDFLFLPVSSLVPCGVPNLFVGVLEGLPRLALLLRLYDVARNDFGLPFSRFTVQVPVEHFPEKVALVDGFLEQPIVVLLFTHDSDVTDVTADHVSHEIVDFLCIVVRRMQICHHW